MNPTKVQHDARKARDALLARAEWIIDANIKAACGYVPVLPPDLANFMDPNVDPDPKALASLLKAVMPAITLADDRRKSNLPHGMSPMQEAAMLIEQGRAGQLSSAEVNEKLVLLGKYMDMEERMALVDFVNSYQPRVG